MPPTADELQFIDRWRIQDAQRRAALSLPEPVPWNWLPDGSLLFHSSEAAPLEACSEPLWKSTP